MFGGDTVGLTTTAMLPFREEAVAWRTGRSVRVGGGSNTHPVGSCVARARRHTTEARETVTGHVEVPLLANNTWCLNIWK